MQPIDSTVPEYNLDNLEALGTQEVKSPTGDQVTTGQAGRSGTYIFSGIITNEEYNSDLTRWEALKNYDIMRRSDATIGAALSAVKLPIISATYSIQAASEDAADVDAADFVRRELFDREIDFVATLREILNFVEFGYAVYEKVWQDTHRTRQTG
jgi:hypothetical protein